MKTVEMDRDFAYLPHPSQSVMYRKGQRYERVPEAAVKAITEKGAGRVVAEDAEPEVKAEAAEAVEPKRGRR